MGQQPQGDREVPADAIWGVFVIKLDRIYRIARIRFSPQRTKRAESLFCHGPTLTYTDKGVVFEKKLTTENTEIAETESREQGAERKDEHRMIN